MWFKVPRNECANRLARRGFISENPNKMIETEIRGKSF